jgi:hypothetical protein
MTAESFGSTGGTVLTWRPHPRESSVSDFRKFKRVAEQLGFQVDNTCLLADQVGSHRYVVTTFSGSIGEVAAAGKVPAIFAGLPYEIEGHWGLLSESLKFRTARELDSVLKHLADETWVSARRGELLIQYNQPRAVPHHRPAWRDQRMIPNEMSVSPDTESISHDGIL